MKKILLLVLIACINFPVFAQNLNYEPTTSWPYRYADFTDGVVMTREGALMSSGINMFNLTLAGNKIHYVQNGTIMEADMLRIYSARIGQDIFVNIGGRMYLVLDESDHGMVVKLEEPDLEQMSKTDIGFGISSATASSNTTSLDLLGFGNWEGVHLSGQTYTQARGKIGNGTPFPIRSSLYIVVDGRRIDADKKSVMKYPGVDAAAAKAFFKAHKIKWNKVESLMEVVDFVYGQLHASE